MKTNEQADFIPFFKPSFTKEEEDAVLRILRSGWLTTGKETLLFENEFSTMTNSPYSLAVNSASSGLLLAMDAFGVRKGAKILTSPYTFTSTATSALHLGAEVVYADIEKETYNIDPKKIEELVAKDPSIKAIVPVHFAGTVCNMKAINEIANHYNIAVIEDAAHAFPAVTEDGFAGCLGDAGVYSFYATKTITTGEGGMVNVKDESIANRIKLMRSHGINKTIWDRYTSKQASWEYDVIDEGWKCNLPDILSAIGRVQLTKAFTFYEKRKKIAQQYNEVFKKYDCFEIPPDGPGNAWHLYVLRLKLERLIVSRNEFSQALQDAGLGISMHFIPHFELTFFKNKYSLKSEDFQEAKNKFETSISLPFWPDMSENDVERVITTVIEMGQKYTKGL